MPEVKPLIIVSPLHKATRQLSVYLTARMERIGVPPQAGHLLSYVAAYAPCSIPELRRVFGYRPSTLTSVLNRLEDAALVVRRIDPNDRRSFLVEGTPQGQRKGREARRLVEELEAELLEGLDPEQVEAFRAVIGAIGALTQVDLRRRE